MVTAASASCTGAGAAIRMWCCGRSTSRREDVRGLGRRHRPDPRPRSGEITSASLFVAVLGASTYTFARAALEPGSGELDRLPCASIRVFPGRPRLVVPDNPRTGVTRACRYEPDLNRTYHEMAQHYGVAVMPARPNKPRDKAKVENAVLIVERWIWPLCGITSFIRWRS